ncbi:hypothetical protein [Oleiagrimonas soli]|uniref:Polyketide cyclase n=1 Tax=Oleiagrimonas soli TaxID=1543381 RepID=A0A099CVZ1_9GAMM|nr:hypothetical protein [Oleiagrimonas soli]KGI77841.1 hypothetical protein LF63_0105350 [Oleiagrimonas soli]MBB6183816.1 hypothetical protein [Oleiagrimonas soli]
MTRVLEFITALIIVAVLAVVVGVLMPSTGHVQRTTMVSKDIRDVYDVFNNFRRFKDYAVLRAYDPSLTYSLEGKAYGPGAAISWTSNVPKVGNGRLEIVSADPGFADVADQGSATIVWKVQNDWPGHNKRFTIDMERAGRGKRLVKVTWSYDVDYGWNLLDRYSNLYIHGTPDSMVQYSLGNVQDMLAGVPNIMYDDLNPKLVDTPEQPVLYVSTEAKRNLTEVDAATATAMTQIQDAMKKLGVKQAGPRIIFTTNYGDQSYKFDVAVPIDTSTLKIDGQDYALTAPVVPTLENPNSASSAPAADASAAMSASAAEPAAAASADKMAKADGKKGKGDKADEDTGPKPGSRDKYGHLIVDKNVRGMLAFGGRALEASWTGNPAGIPPTRLKLEAYAATHGYATDTVMHRFYDKQMVAYESKKPDGSEVLYDEQTFDVFLPVTDAPKETPEQEAGLTDQPQSASSAPADASSAPASASSAAAAASSDAPADAESAN